MRESQREGSLNITPVPALLKYWLLACVLWAFITGFYLGRLMLVDAVLSLFSSVLAGHLAREESQEWRIDAQRDAK